MAQHNTTTTPTSLMVAELMNAGYHAISTFQTTHNLTSHEIRVYQKGASTLMLHVHHDWDCDLYMPTTQVPQAETICSECHYPNFGTCDNPACPADKSGRQLELIREAEEAWIRQKQLEDMWRQDYRWYSRNAS
jgi:hypothetical protein